jgi:hypothetical protein
MWRSQKIQGGERQFGFGREHRLTHESLTLLAPSRILQISQRRAAQHLGASDAHPED